MDFFLNANIIIERKPIEQVQKLSHLGQIITVDAHCEIEIRSTVTAAKNAF